MEEFMTFSYDFVCSFQMKLLVSKREANLPIFLKFACEELRFFGVYEKVSFSFSFIHFKILTIYKFQYPAWFKDPAWLQDPSPQSPLQAKTQWSLLWSMKFTHCTAKTHMKFRWSLLNVQLKDQWQTGVEGGLSAHDIFKGSMQEFRQPKNISYALCNPVLSLNSIMPPANKLKISWHDAALR